MVLVLKKWEDLQDYVEQFPRAEVLYKIDMVNGKVRIRVMAGRVGLDEFFDEDNPELKGILEILKRVSGKEVARQELDDQFFYGCTVTFSFLMRRTASPWGSRSHTTSSPGLISRSLLTSLGI